MGLFDDLIGMGIAAAVSNSPKAKSAVTGMMNDYNNQKAKVQKNYDRYTQDAATMSTEQLKQACRNLRDSNDNIKKSAYASELKRRMQ